MNLRRSSLVALLAILAAGVAIGSAPQNASEEPAVRHIVETYLHGLKFNDVASFQEAFVPDAKLLFVRKNGELGQLTQEQWYKGFAANAGKEEKGELRIASVDITGNAAAVKVVEVYEDSTYTDYISLLKLPGGWRIVNKVFTYERHAK